MHPAFDYKQPLSGQFAMRRELTDALRIDDRWGVDIQILLQVAKTDARIVEVDIGKLRHKKQPIESLAMMSEEVMKSILSEMGLIANRHRLVIFDFDRTIIEESSVEVLAAEFGFGKELESLRAEHAAGRLRDWDITLSLAKLLKGRTDEDIKKACRKMHLTRNMDKVAERLHKRKYELGIISVAFFPVVEYFAEKMGIRKENVICPILLKDRRGRYTGEVVAKTTHNSECCDRIICKADAAAMLMEELGVKPGECIAVGDGASDECLFSACGLSLAYRPTKQIGDLTITDMTEVLINVE